MNIVGGTYTYSLEGRPSMQSSTYYNDEGGHASSDKAVDGNTDPMYFGSFSCTHTRVEDEPWWAVDAEEIITVFSVTIVNRGDCCGKLD